MNDLTIPTGHPVISTATTRLSDSTSTAQTGKKSQADASSQASTVSQISTDSKELDKLLKQIQDKLNGLNLSINFSTYGNDPQKVAIKVTNKETGDVIREIPPQQIQDLSAKIDVMIGLLLNQQT